MTPLGREIAELIRKEGAISIERYMALCLGHPTHGYYMTRDPLGALGDFTTAPEISQMFGELLGVWSIAAWQTLGAPRSFALVELGPGRGTLMADVLRTLRKQSQMATAAQVHLVETSPVLREAQRLTLGAHAANVTWHDSIETLPACPAIVLANEFFDALPMRQLEYHEGWCERLVDIGPDGNFCFRLSDTLAPGPEAETGAIQERSPASLDIMQALASRLSARGGVLLAVDYGYATPAFGDTLQALSRHRFADPLAAPGEADLTAHVDFTALADCARGAGAAVFPLLTQHTLLTRLGLNARAAVLAQAHPDRANAILVARDRLSGTGAAAMGGLFKALCVASPGVQPYGFDTPDPLIENE